MNDIVFNAVKGGTEQTPTSSDLLFKLDGTILNSLGTYYFVDKTANNRNFLITNYDFPIGWVKGFPYKSRATISAPIGDTTLIAADINNFLYDSGGNPNQISVNQLFSNVEFANIIYSKRVEQSVNILGVETYQPKVIEVAMYNSARTGGEITACDTYFNAETKLGSGFREVGSGKTYSTINAAITAASAGETIYVYNGTFKETTYLNISKNITIQGVGRCIVQSTGGTNTIYTTSTATIKNINIDSENLKTNVIGGSNAVYTLTLDRCNFINIQAGIIANQTNPRFNIKNSIIWKDTNTFASATINNSTIDTCYSKNILFGVRQDSTVKNSLLFGNLNTQAAYITLYDANYTMYGCTTEHNGVMVVQSGSVGMTTLKTNTIHHNIFNIIDATSSGRQNGVANLGNTAINRNVVFENNYISQVGQFTSNATLFGVKTLDSSLTARFNICLSETTTTYFQALYTDYSASAVAMPSYLNYNTITSAATSDIILGIGGERGYLNISDNSEIIGNRIIGGSYVTGGVHGIMANCGINITVKYNYVSNCRYGIVVKTGLQDTYTANGVSYNIVKDCNEGIRVRGVIGLQIVNNSIKSNTGIYLDENSVQAGTQNCADIDCINNAIDAATVCFNFDTAAALTCTANNNYVYSSSNMMTVGVTTYATLAEAQSAGYMNNCINANPGFDSNLIPATALLNAVETVGYNVGLNISSVFGVENGIVTKNQNAIWEFGGFIKN